MRTLRSYFVRALSACVFTAFAAAACFAAPEINVSGGINPNGFNTPGLFTWHAQMPIDCTGYAPGNVDIILYGPLNSIGISPSSRTIATVVADGSGHFNGNVQIPYDEGGPYTIPRPGYYELRAVGGSGGDATPPHINICPATYKFDSIGIDWSYERGGRDGGVGGIKKVFPHWMHVWENKPEQMWGECSYTDTDGNNMPSFMRHSEYPGDHYAHDFNIMLVPDDPYRWVLGTANYYNIEADEPNREYGRLEVEDEMLNNGGISYGSGLIGMPLCVLPTPGDRIYVVGNWVLDAGHPDKGDRSECHPPRLLVTIRKRPTVTPLTAGSACMTYASAVDVYLTPHFGGGGRLFYSHAATLGAGGRVRDVQADTSDYYDNPLGDSGLDTEPFASNGGYNRLPEQQTINDMDYDFDVPLPAPPAGATTPQCLVTHQQNHSTSMNEVITYTNPVAGLPTIAHVHLPANGGDNGIYSANLKFYWDKWKPPAKHFQILPQNIHVKDDSDPALSTGEWYMWADVAGKWINLRDLNHDAFEDADDDDDLGIGGAGAIDVYVNPGDPLYMAAFGYEQDCLDSLFGTGFGWDATAAALSLAACALDLFEPLDNDDLAGAIFKFDNPTKTTAPGDYTVDSAVTPLNEHKSYYNMSLKVVYVEAPPRIEMNGVPADFGNVCLNDFEDHVIEIFNVGEKDLDVNSITVSGDGFSRLGSPNVPFTIAGGEHVDITVRFSPTAITQGVGTITFDSTDPCQGHLVFALSGVVNYPKGTLSGSLSYGQVPVDDRTTGSSITRNFHVNNTGGCPLTVTGASVLSAGTEFAIGTLPSFPQTIQPGGSLNIPVVFNPTSQGLKSGTIQVNLGNDPTNANLTINMDGTGIVPFATATPSDTHFKPTVVGFSKTQTITLFNNGPAELIIDNIVMNGTSYSVSPVNLPVRLAPNASTNFTVTFAPQSVARRLDGSLVFTTNDPNHPTVTDTFCGEGVNCGFRLLVQQANGTAYAKVDMITLTSFGVKPSTKTSLKNAPVVTINPPTSCDIIQYHMEKMPLPSTDQNNKKGSYYNLAVKVGNKSQNKSFTLAPSDFLEIVIKLQ